MSITRIKGLDGVRGISIILVILAHLGVFEVLPIEYEFLISGRTGVEIFFVLSGYLITHLLIIECNSNGNINLRNFYVRRILRIMPAYWAFLIFCTLISIAGFIRIDGISLTLAWLHIYNFIPQDNLTGILTHTWSLAVEEHFYLLWPFLLCIALRKSIKLQIFMASLWLFVCIVFSYRIALVPGIQDYFFPSWWSIPASGSIVAGALLAIITRPGNRTREYTLIRSNHSTRRGDIACIAALITPFLIFYFIEWSKTDIENATLHWLRSISIVAILYTILNLHQRSSILRILDSNPLSWLGKISYSIYLWQGFFLTTHPRESVNSTWPMAMYLSIPLTIIFAVGSHYTIEKYFLSMKSKFSSR